MLKDPRAYLGKGADHGRSRLKTLLLRQAPLLHHRGGRRLRRDLILVQVGLFLGMLDNATVTIEHLPPTSGSPRSNTPNVDFAHKFPETTSSACARRPACERADNLIVCVHERALPTGAQETTSVYALRDFGAGASPGT